MAKLRKAGVGAAVAVVLAVIVGFVPIVSYSAPFAPGSSSTSAPSSVTGRSSLLYWLVGVGEGPFPSVAAVDEGNYTAVVHFNRGAISYWEGPFPAGTDLNPSGVVKITNVTMAQWAFGLINFSASVTNLGSKPIYNLSVIFRYPTYGRNETVGGLTRYIGPSVVCSSSLNPSSSCTAVMSLPQSQSLLVGEDYPLSVEAWSPGGQTGAAEYAQPFILSESSHMRYQGAALSPQWVNDFIVAVNEKRNTTALTENKTLDEFAAFRYDSIRAQYQISDYNFAQDYARFFGTSHPAVFEEILYPQDQSASTFTDYLHDNAPGHWLGLMNPSFTHFGYFFGIGPSVVIGPGCTAKEIPGPNINITQYVISHGCDYVIADQVWFILILGE